MCTESDSNSAGARGNEDGSHDSAVLPHKSVHLACSVVYLADIRVSSITTRAGAVSFRLELR